MNSVVEDISNMLLAESSMNLTLGGNLHLYREPAFPNETVSVFDTPGMPPEEVLSANEDSSPYERPSIQIRIKTSKPKEGFELAYKINALLHGRAQEIWGDYFYSIIYSINSPTMLDWGANNETRIVLNFNIQRRLIVKN